MSKSFEEHFSLIAEVLGTLRTYNIKLKPSNCEWFTQDAKFLGHIVSTNSIRKTLDYVNSIDSFPRPETFGI